MALPQHAADIASISKRRKPALEMPCSGSLSSDSYGYTNAPQCLRHSGGRCFLQPRSNLPRPLASGLFFDFHRTGYGHKKGRQAEATACRPLNRSPEDRGVCQRRTDCQTRLAARNDRRRGLTFSNRAFANASNDANGKGNRTNCN